MPRRRGLIFNKTPKRGYKIIHHNSEPHRKTYMSMYNPGDGFSDSEASPSGLCRVNKKRKLPLGTSGVGPLDVTQTSESQRKGKRARTETTVGRAFSAKPDGSERPGLTIQAHIATPGLPGLSKQQVGAAQAQNPEDENAPDKETDPADGKLSGDWSVAIQEEQPQHTHLENDHDIEDIIVTAVKTGQHAREEDNEKDNLRGVELVLPDPMHVHMDQHEDVMSEAMRHDENASRADSNAIEAGTEETRFEHLRVGELDLGTQRVEVHQRTEHPEKSSSEAEGQQDRKRNSPSPKKLTKTQKCATVAEQDVHIDSEEFTAATTSHTHQGEDVVEPDKRVPSLISFLGASESPRSTRNEAGDEDDAVKDPITKLQASESPPSKNAGHNAVDTEHLFTTKLAALNEKRNLDYVRKDEYSWVTHISETQVPLAHGRNEQRTRDSCAQTSQRLLQRAKTN